MMEFDIRRAALAAAVSSVELEFRHPGDRYLPQATERTLAVAEEYAQWLRDGVQADEESYRKDMAAMEAEHAATAPLAPVQALPRPRTPEEVAEEVWGTDKCAVEGCGHLTSVHTLNGECYATAKCPCSPESRTEGGDDTTEETA